MVARLPFEIVDHIVGYLDVEDVRSIARVCSAFRLPAQIRLFSSIDIASSPSKAYPGRIESILSSPHLLQYSSRLLVQCIGSMQQNSIQSLWPHLPVMYRLRNMYIYLGPGDCSRALSALESLGSGREIALDFRRNLAPNLLISDNPLPIHTLELRVDTSNHQVATRLVQKCSQSLRRLRLILRDNTTPPLPFLPHLYEFFVYTHLHEKGKELDLMSLFPFLDQHPTITRLLLGNEFTLAVQPPPNLLPNLQFLGATPPIIDRLILGRPVNDIDAICPSQASRFPVDIMLQPLRQSFVPVTTLAIDADIYFPYDDLINILRALPKLRKFTLRWSWHEVSVGLEGLLTALGGCEDMVHIRVYLSFYSTPRDCVRPLWSRGNFVQMVQRVQENGAAGLWSLELRANMSHRREGCEATRVGWLDVPWQSTLRGEWKFDLCGSSSDSDMPISA